MVIATTDQNEKLKSQIREALKRVNDPEIPALSVIDLGIIIDIQVDAEHNAKVIMTPTFSGCPALKIIQEQVRVAAQKVEGVKSAQVDVSYDVQWNSNMISDEGRQKMEKFGITPPACYQDDLDVSVVENAKCAHCGSENTTMQTPFGPTLCRSIHYCYDCQETFEQFKPVG